MASSSSFAQLDGIEFKVSDVVKLKPYKFKPLNITLRDPTDLLLNSEHDFSTEKKVLEWATVKQHRSSVKRPKKTVNAEMRLELESKLRTFVNTQKQNDVETLTNGISEVKAPAVHDNHPQVITTNSSPSPLSTSQSSGVLLPTEQTSPQSISPLSNSNRTSPFENAAAINDIPPPIPLRRTGVNVSVPEQTPPVPLPRMSNPVFNTNQSEITFPQISVANPHATNTQSYPQISLQNYRSYSPNNPFLSDLKDQAILQPQPANVSSSMKNTAEIDNAKIWADFENKDLDPFNNLELKSLDDMQELSRVLESNPSGQPPVSNLGHINGPTAAATPVTIAYPNLNPPLTQPSNTAPYNFVNLSGT